MELPFTCQSITVSAHAACASLPQTAAFSNSLSKRCLLFVSLALTVRYFKLKNKQNKVDNVEWPTVSTASSWCAEVESDELRRTTMEEVNVRKFSWVTCLLKKKKLFSDSSCLLTHRVVCQRGQNYSIFTFNRKNSGYEYLTKSYIDVCLMLSTSYGL